MPAATAADTNKAGPGARVGAQDASSESGPGSDSSSGSDSGSGPGPDKPPLESLLSAHDFEAVASRTLSPKAWAFVSSAATDSHTKARNASAYASIGLRPRGLCDVSAVDTRTSLLGSPLSLPLFCSPTAMARLVHPEGERDIGRACRAAGVGQCVSTSASFALADIVAAIDDEEQQRQRQRKEQKDSDFQVPLLFQLYVDKNRDNSRRLLQQAQRCGAKAIILTIDAPVPGKREADERIGIAPGQHLGSPLSGATAANDSKGGAIGRVMGGYIDASVSWPDIAWLRSCVPGMPLVLKGVQTYEDALLARDAGVDAIIVSNHGGRSLDTSPPTILVLLELRRNCPEVFNSMEVYVDGGVTRGTDIFKALCLGAKAVGIGRGCLYALNYGRQGVVRYIDILRDEFETTMKMCGVTKLDQLHPGYLNTLAVDHLIPKRYMGVDAVGSRL